MLTHHVALVSEDKAIKLEELTSVAAALAKQVSRDFAPIWRVEADVTAFAKLEDVPLDYWPVIIKDDIGDPTAAGYHEDQHGQPFSLVAYENGWPLTASHEVLEMLGDPFGRRMVAGNSPVKGQGRVKFLVEVCDPCEADEFSYTINGVRVSDFYTPHYFDPLTSPQVRYSYTGALTEPRQVLRGGYLSWLDVSTGLWWQRSWFGAKMTDDKLTEAKISGNVREAIDRINAVRRAKAMKPKGIPAAAKKMAARAAPAANPFSARAQSLRKAIKAAGA